ncbi:MAG: YciI family protein [Thermodesulfobacteriota bacterium]
MATQPISEYMLLFRGTHWFKGLSPEEIQQIVDQMHAWLDRLTAEGKAKTGQPLMFEGKIVSQKNGRVVSDGPFAESKEAIAGYFLLNVKSLDEAVVIAKDYPGLKYGATVEVRPVAPECAASLALLDKDEEEVVSQAGASQFN